MTRFVAETSGRPTVIVGSRRAAPKLPALCKKRHQTTIGRLGSERITCTGGWLIVLVVLVAPVWLLPDMKRLERRLTDVLAACRSQKDEFR